MSDLFFLLIYWHFRLAHFFVLEKPNLLNFFGKPREEKVVVRALYRSFAKFDWNIDILCQHRREEV